MHAHKYNHVNHNNRNKIQRSHMLAQCSALPQNSHAITRSTALAPMHNSTTSVRAPATHASVILFLIYVIFAVLGSLLAFFLRSVAEVSECCRVFRSCSILAWTECVLRIGAICDYATFTPLDLGCPEVNSYILVHGWVIFAVDVDPVLWRR